MEMNSESAAGWLNGPSVKTGFLEWLAPNAIIKGRAYPLVVQFILLHFRPDRESKLRAIKADNGMEAGSFLRA